VSIHGRAIRGNVDEEHRPASTAAQPYTWGRHAVNVGEECGPASSAV